MSHDFDPQDPFIAKDGLEYEDFAAYILGSPLDSWRNAEILGRRARGELEERTRAWIQAFDGDDYAPSSPSHGIRERQIRAWRDA